MRAVLLLLTNFSRFPSLSLPPPPYPTPLSLSIYISLPLSASRPPSQVLDFLHKNRSEGATAAAIDSAAHNGHIQAVRWLTSNIPSLAATAAAMDGAACAGHLEVVKYLHEARGEGCTTEAMDAASRRGHFEVQNS